MSEEQLKTKEYYESKIKLWTEQIEKSRNPLDQIELDEKIKEARACIKKLEYQPKEKNVSPIIDASTVADRLEDKTIKLERGQIMDAGTTIKAMI